MARDNRNTRPGGARNPRNQGARSDTFEGALAEIARRRQQQGNRSGSGSGAPSGTDQSQAQENWNQAIRIGPGASTYTGPPLLAGPSRQGGMPVRSEVDRDAIGLKAPGPRRSSLQDLLADIFGTENPNAGLAAMIAGSVPSGGGPDIGAALRPFDDATNRVNSQYDEGLATLASLDQEAARDRGLSDQATRARLAELTAATVANQDTLRARTESEGRYTAGDLAAQGIDPAVAAQMSAASQAGNEQLAAAQGASNDQERAMAERRMASEAAADAETARGSRRDLTMNRDDALAALAMERAQTEAALQAQAQEYAMQQQQAQIDAQLQAAGLMADGNAQRQEQFASIMEMLGGMPGGGFAFDQRDDAMRQIAQFGQSHRGSPRGDILSQILNPNSGVSNFEDYMAAVEDAIGGFNSANPDRAGGAWNPDRQWFADIGSQWFTPSQTQLSPDAEAMLRLMSQGYGGF